MKIERMIFQISPPQHAKDFISLDSKIWNPWLRRQPGFINKISREIGGGRVELVLFWDSERSIKRAAEKEYEMRNNRQLLEKSSPGKIQLLTKSL